MGSKDNIDALMFSLKDDTEIQKFFEEDVEEIENDHKIDQEEEDLPPHDLELKTEKNDELLEKNGKPSLSKRLFGKIEAGSIRGSIFNMIILSLGTGCLSLPKVMADMSLFMGLVSIILTGLGTYWTLYIVTTTSEKYKIFNYSKLTRKLFGNLVGFILDFTVLFYIFGILILYQVVIFKTIGEVVYNLGGLFNSFNNMEEFIETSFWDYLYVKLLVMYGVTLFFILPLCLLKDVSKLRMASLLGVITLVFLIIMIVIQCPFYIEYYRQNVYKEDDPKTHLNIFNIASGFDSNLFFFQGTATLFYSYTCHLGAFPIFNSLKNNLMRRIHKVIIRTLLLDCLFFIVIAICGYLTWPINTPPLIIGRENIAGGADIIMSVGRIALIIILIMKLPNSYNSFRISFLEMIFGDSKVTTKRYLFNLKFYLLEICFLLFQLYASLYLLPYYTTRFWVILNYWEVFVLLFWVMLCQANEYPLLHWKNIMTIILILLIGTIGFTSGIITLIGIITGKGH